MKKNNILITMLFVMYILLPVCDIFLSIINYDLTLISYDAFAVMLGVVSLVITILVMSVKEKTESKPAKAFAALMPIVHIINWFCYIWHKASIVMIFSMIICFACSVVICIGYARPVVFKILPVALAVLMIFPTFIFYAVTNIGKNTVVETAYSPSGRHYCEVIDSDQGALGGNTLVKAYDSKGTLNLFVVKLSPKPKTVYVGEWGEYKDIDVYWQSGDTLHINGKEYTFNGE